MYKQLPSGGRKKRRWGKKIGWVEIGTFGIEIRPRYLTEEMDPYYGRKIRRTYKSAD